GPIPAGQTVEVQGETFNCSGNVCQTTTLTLGGNGSSPQPVTNHGTLILDTPGTGTTSGGPAVLAGTELDNYGTLTAQIEDAGYSDGLAAKLVNETGVTVTLTG